MIATDRKYSTLTRVLDGIRNEPEAATYAKKYANGNSEPDAVKAARARAYIHLLLRVRFGVFSFDACEHFITDGSQDGGVDAYYIDNINKTVYFIQSKFRDGSVNYEEKNISIGEIIAMDIDRILKGESEDKLGNLYSGKIWQLQRELADIADIARFKYRIIILANVRSSELIAIEKIFDPHEVEIINHQLAYRTLVLPIITGTIYPEDSLVIYIDVSTKSTGSETYSVTARGMECDITVIFVPTLAIARAMARYRNSILKYNPRYYLEHSGTGINADIAATIVDRESNEFALMNNGITLISDETDINTRIGQKNKAQLRIVNPQIINGGQTAYTLSRILMDTPVDAIEERFGGKEVLLKVITLPAECDRNIEDRNKLIDDISRATNSQTAVTHADRAANEPMHERLRDLIFSRYGLLYESKRGEYADGMKFQYVNNQDVVDKSSFYRVYAAVAGDIELAKQRRITASNNVGAGILEDLALLDRWAFYHRVYERLNYLKNEKGKSYSQLENLIMTWIASNAPRQEESIEKIVADVTNRWNEYVNRRTNIALRQRLENAGAFTKSSTKTLLQRIVTNTGEIAREFGLSRTDISGRFVPNDRKRRKKVNPSHASGADQGAGT